MSRAIVFVRIFLTIFVIMICSCSNPQKDFQNVENLQALSAQNIHNATDVTAKLKACDTVITACQGYMNKYPTSDWNEKAKVILNQWAATKQGLVEEVNEQTDFTKIQQLQNSAMQVVQNSNDFAVRLKACTDMVNSLQGYLSEYKSGDWVSAAQTMLMSWQSQKTTLENQLSDLGNRLYGILKQDAINAAMRRYSLSDIQTMTLQDRKVTEAGSQIQVTDTYFVRMVGRLAGTSIFKLNITVTGIIIPETKEAKATFLKVDE